jgi:hypothetical protein
VQPIAIIIIGLSCFVFGAFTLLGYILHRMMGNDGWDDSNITNALRLLSHVTLHPEDFGKMYYLSNDMKNILNGARTPDSEELPRPFWYVDKDELSEVVKTRPL